MTKRFTTVCWDGDTEIERAGPFTTWAKAERAGEFWNLRNSDEGEPYFSIVDADTGDEVVDA